MIDVIVIGGGPAGVTAALRAREIGATVALVEKGRLGGTCTNDGCVPTRVLARTARLLRDYEQFATYGLIAERPKVDFEKVIARTQQVVYQMHEKKQLRAHMEQLGIDAHIDAGGAEFVDANTIRLGDGTELQGSKFIICAGGHARRFEFPGSEYALTHHDVWSMKALPGRIAIVGGAATGSQLASILEAFGATVHLLEVAPNLFGREDELLARTLESAFRRRGIDVHTGISGVERIDKTANGLRLQFGKGDESHTLDVDAVLLAVGWVGNGDSLNLAAAGLEVGRGGYIPIDDTFRTAVPHIFAAGDITGRMMLVQSGSAEGRIAAENAVLGGDQTYAHAIVPHGGFTDPEYGAVGLTEAQAREQGHEIAVAVVPFSEMDRAVIDGLTEGFCKLIVSQETHRILGAHIVGEQALEVTQIVAAGMAADMWVEELAELELAYPTYSAVVGLAARRILRELGVTPLADQWRVLSRAAAAAEWEQKA